MVRLNIHEAKTHLSRHLENLQEEGVIVLCKRNVPVAEIRPLPRKSSRRRPIGLGPAGFSVPPSFHEPLPPGDVDAFESRS